MSSSAFLNFSGMSSCVLVLQFRRRGGFRDNVEFQPLFLAVSLVGYVEIETDRSVAEDFLPDPDGLFHLDFFFPFSHSLRFVIILFPRLIYCTSTNYIEFAHIMETGQKRDRISKK